MRRTSAIFFFMVILLAQTPMQQVLKFPVLIEHYKEHRADNKSLSFLDFIALHYFSGNPKDSDYDRDMQLPFRANDVVLIYSTVVVPQDITIDVLPTTYTRVAYPLSDHTQLSPRHGHGIWQPPKRA